VPALVAGGYQPVSLAREADPNRIMLHLDSAAPERMQAALDQAERLAGRGRTAGARDAARNRCQQQWHQS
jgi:hypothetical protein